MKLVKLIGILFLSSFCLSCAAGSAATKKASYHYQMGLSNFAEGNYTSALVEFTEAESLTPDDPELLYYLGRTYFEKKKYDLAEQRYHLLPQPLLRLREDRRAAAGSPPSSRCRRGGG